MRETIRGKKKLGMHIKKGISLGLSLSILVSHIAMPAAASSAEDLISEDLIEDVITMEDPIMVEADEELFSVSEVSEFSEEEETDSDETGLISFDESGEQEGLDASYITLDSFSEIPEDDSVIASGDDSILADSDFPADDTAEKSVESEQLSDDLISESSTAEQETDVSDASAVSEELSDEQVTADEEAPAAIEELTDWQETGFVDEQAGVDELSASEETAVPEEPSAEEELLDETDAETETDDVSIFETETETEPDLIEAETEDELWVLEEETAELVSPEKAPDADESTLSTTSARTRRLLRAASVSGTSYVYGSQLSGNASLFYEFLVNKYITEGSTELTASETMYQNTSRAYDMGGYTSEVNLTTTSGKTAIDRTDERYKTICANVTADVQSAWDAFCYDYPELYWYHTKTVSMKISRSTGSDTTATARITAVDIIAVEKFSSARSFASEFQAGVDQAVSIITNSADYNGDSSVSDMELLQAAHDYIINRMSYDYDRLKIYNAGGSSDYTIFCAAGAFIDNNAIGTSFVCEGYAKAYKILCDRFGITCVLVPGLATPTSSVGHMWNAVQVNGSWYLVDCTWDDTGSGVQYKYYMFGYGYNNDGSTDSRAPYQRFSGNTNNAQTFTTPAAAITEARIFEKIDMEVSSCSDYQQYICTSDDSLSYYLNSSHTLDSEGICTVCGHTLTDLEGAEVLLNAEVFTYTGREIKPSVSSVTTADGKSVSSRAYTVAYSNHVNAGIASVLITARANSDCTGSVTKTFTIRKASLTDATLSQESCIYTGSPLTPTVSSVQAENSLIVSDSEYTAAYSDNINAGTASVTITANADSNYTGSVTKTFTIDKAALSDAVLSETLCIYTGEACEPAVSHVTAESGLSVPSSEYTAVYSDNTAAGTASVTITANENSNYTGSVTKTFSIKAALTSAALSQTSYTYDGNSCTPDVSAVTASDGQVLDESLYTVTYENNVNAGTASVTITANADSNYTGSVTKTFTIRKASLTDATLSEEPCIYTGSPLTPTVSSVQAGSGLIVSDGEYTAAYSDNINVGTASVTITANADSNYTGSVTKMFTIDKAALSDAVLSETLCIYRGEACEPAVSHVTAESGLSVPSSEYTAVYSDNTAAGTASVTITANENSNYTGSVKKTFSIKAALTSAALSQTSYTYDGNSFTPDVSAVTASDGQVLDESLYTVTYENNVNAGKASVRITANADSNYTGSVTKTFGIKAALTSAALSRTSYTYDGKSCTPDVSAVTASDGQVLDESLYTVTYKNNVNAGTASVTIAAKEDSSYTGSVTKTFTINQAVLGSASLSQYAYTYTGSAFTPAVSNVKTTNNLTVSSSAYTVTYKNNVNAGTASVTITANAGSSFTGSLTKTFTINKAALNSASLSQYAYTYTGSAFTPAVSNVKTTNNLTVSSSAYTVTYKNNVNAGTASVTITANEDSSYTGSVTKTFTINKAALNSASLSEYAYTYTGSAFTPAVSNVKTTNNLTVGSSAYTVTYKNNVNAGTASVTITANAGSSYTGSVTKTFTINKAALTKVTVPSARRVYNGKKQTQKITVTGNGRTLTSGTDYSVTYSGSKNIGTASVTVKGKGNYTGTLKASFRIVPARASLKSVTAAGSGKVNVKWKKVSGVTGYQIRYSTNKKFTSSSTKTVKKAAAVKTTLKKLKKKKTYYVSIRAYKTVKGVKYYGDWSKSMKVKVK